MSKIVQEKFQAEFLPAGEGVETGRWLDDKTARVKKGTPNQGEGLMTLSLPPDMDIEDQEFADIRHQREVMQGETDVSYDCVDAGVAKRGFIRKKMLPTDDLYTNEHVDMFYGEISVEVEDGQKETGFLERGNMLDRL